MAAKTTPTKPTSGDDGSAAKTRVDGTGPSGNSPAPLTPPPPDPDPDPAAAPPAPDPDPTPDPEPEPEPEPVPAAPVTRGAPVGVGDGTTDDDTPAVDGGGYVYPRGGSPFPPADLTVRPPAATLHHTGTRAAPLVPPDRHTQREPETGIADSTTNLITGAAQLQSLAGEVHRSICDRDGNPLSIEDMFVGGDTASSSYVTSQRIYEKYRPPNQSTDMMRLLHPAGTNVARTIVDGYRFELGRLG